MKFAEPKNLEWTDELVSRFWAYHARTPEVYFTQKLGDRIVLRLRKYFRAKENILDYGCGVGSLLHHLLQFDCRVTGVDFSKESVAQTAKLLGGRQNFMGAFTIKEIVRRKSQFDAIFMIEVIEHLNDHYLSETIENIGKLLAPGGVLMITTPNDEDLESNTVYCPSCNSRFHNTQHMRTWNAESLSQFVQRSGLSVVTTFTTDFTLSFRRKPLWFVFNELLYGLRRRKRPHLVCVAERAMP